MGVATIAASCWLFVVASAPASVPENHAASVGRNSISLNLGMGSTVGVVGLTYGRDLGPSAEMELGAGYGYSGAVLASMIKVWTGSPRSRWLFGIGFAVGAPGMELVHGDHVLTPWLTLDLLSHEWITAGGGVFLFAIGSTTALAHGTVNFCSECGDLSLFGWTAPQVRIAFGQRFQ